MRSQGNGTPEQCAFNLLRTVRGEVAFERIKGLNGALVETPNPMDEFTADIEQQLEIYEPRIQADSIDIDGTAADIGNYGVVTRLRRKETPEA